MADAIVSAVAERLIATINEQIKTEIHLVRGADKEVLDLSDELKRIRNVLDDAENRRFKHKNVNDWLVRLEHTSYEMGDILDEWNYAILKLKMERDQSDDHAAVAPLKQKVCSFIQPSCLCFKKTVVRHDIAKKIQNVKAQLDKILKEHDRYNFVTSQPATDPSPRSWRGQSSSLIDLDKVHGRVIDKDNLVTKLVSNSHSQELGLHILSIVGVGGIGKTTLAQLVYNDSEVEGCFQLRIWICVSDPFDVVAIAKGIIESVKPKSSPNTDELDVLFKHVIESISRKRFLLILDDVWTEDSNKWEPLEICLKSGAAGSTIMVTTRNQRVAKTMGTMDDDIHHVGKLSDEDCWLVLRRIALFGRNELEIEKFEDIGKRIAVEKCNGLPLAAKTLGSLLRFKNTPEEWESVLNSEMWDIKEVNEEVFRHLFLSYNELSPTLKRCFSFCAVFPKDSRIYVEELIGYWMALGYLGSNISDDMELKGRECFNILAMRSLFQDFHKNDLDGHIDWCQMHDIVHDFAQFVRKNGRTDDAGINKTSCPACDPVLVSTVNVNEFRSVIWDKRSPPNFCGCLTRLRVLSFPEEVDPRCGLPQGILENMIHLRWLSLSGIELSHKDLKIIFQLYNLQTLWLKDCGLQEIPREIGNLIYLRHLNLNHNKDLKELPESICGLRELQTLWLEDCGLQEIPREIGNLIYLRHLNLIHNKDLKELPESICGLRELRTLNIGGCENLSGLPEGIHGLINLKHLFNWFTNKLIIPQGLAKLTGLRRLNEFCGGSGWNKLGLLKNLNSLSGSLKLRIRLTNSILEDGMVEDAREADLRKKIHIRMLQFEFEDEMDEKEESSVRMDVLDALEPHPGLRDLQIEYYKGSKLPSWITSLNKLRDIRLEYFNHMSSLPSFGKFPFLEKILINYMSRLHFVGREFLGITTTGGGGGRGADMDAIQSSSDWIAFPKLKKLTFASCDNWKEWEDITAEEEDSTNVLVMPCLTELTIVGCEGLTALPHRLLRKVSSTLEVLDISVSKQLQQQYEDKDGFAWKSISQQNPRLQLISDHSGFTYVP